MSAGIADRAARWRELAAEARENAELMSDPRSKRIMLSIAEAYQRLARRAEERKSRQDQEPEN